MKIIDSKRAGPLLLMLSLAVIGSMIMLMMAAGTTPQDSVSAQDCVPPENPLSAVPGTNVCPDDNETPEPPADDGDCVSADNPISALPDTVICADVGATATAMAAMDATATAMAANATATAMAANATATARADNATATAVAAEATASVVAATAAAETATAQAIANETATAQARNDARTAIAMDRTAVAQETVTAGGVPPPAPRATATPVMVENVDVMAAGEAVTIEPEMAATLTAGNVTVKFPTLSRARTFQAMLSESGDCGDMAVACAMMTIYTAEGEMESDVRLISSAEIEVHLDAAAVAALGGDLDGAAVAIQANALGGIQLQLMDDDSGEWNSIPSTFMANSDGSVTVTGMTRRFSHIALNVDSHIVERARMQVSMALGTPTATPIPTATPVPPTATPEPTPVPPPDTGDASVPVALLLAMAVAASMLALVGTKLIAARVRR